MKQLKVLMVCHSFLPESVGGTEVYTYHLSKALKERGHQVTIVAATDTLARKRYQVIKTQLNGIRVIKIVNSPIHAKCFNDFFIDATVATRFREILAAEGPDLIHFQHVANLSGNLPEIAHHLRVPTVFTLHDYWYLCFRSHLLRPGCGICPGPSAGAYCASCNDRLAPNPTAIPRSSALLKWALACRPCVPNSIVRNLPQSLFPQLLSWLYEKPQRYVDSPSNPGELSILENKYRFSFFKKQLMFPAFVLSPSSHLKKRYEDEGYGEIQVMPLGFPQTTKFQTLPFAGKLKIAFIGNIERDKGVAVLLKELLHFQPLNHLEINIHGRPKDLLHFAEVKKLADMFPSGTTEIWGTYETDKDLTRILSKVHLVVFPSLWEENYPLVVREALLHGVPVLASKYGGIVEVIKDGLNGFLFDPYRQGDLLDKVNLIMSNPAILERISQGARNSNIETIEEHTSKLSGLYVQALSKYQA